MKKTQLLNWILLAFIAFQFSACENEPLEGDFPQEDDTSNAPVGGFVATIDGVGFTADASNGVLSPENTLVISGLKNESDESIVLTIENAAVGVYNITAENGNLNSGLYANPNTPLNPFISTGLFGGIGVLEITLLDSETLKISGTFSFTGVRIAVDDEGNPILDGEGNPTLETVEITSGAFNQIPYTNEDDGSETPINNIFFAKVDGVDFISEAITTTQSEIGGISMVKIVAINSAEQIIRIDIPEDLGVGTFAMEEISNGTKLIALYNSNTGGENLTSNPGTITITKFNTFTGVIEATFEFTASDPLGIDPTVNEITEGAFEIDYITSSGETITSFTAQIDGEFFNSDSILVNETFFNGVSRFSIIANNTETSQKMGLFFPTTIEVGTYEMDMALIEGEEIFAQYTPISGESSTFISSPGTLTIEDYDIEAGIIIGTFSFSGIDQLNVDPTVYQITNGEFVIEF